MAAAERLTIDVTVARDYFDPTPERRARAVELFELGQRGEVELSTAPQGYRLDVSGDLATQLRATFEREGIGQAPQLAYASEVTYPSKNLFPGHFVAGFADAWNDVAANWRSHEWTPPGLADRFHIETHVIEGRDVFLTADQPLRVMCRRLRDEHGINIVAMGLVEYLEGRSG